MLYANRNDNGQWNANVNRLDNDNEWNAGNRLLLRYSSFSPAYRGSFCFTEQIQPYSIWLSATNFSLSTINFLSSIIFISHPIYKKNFIRSRCS